MKVAKLNVYILISPNKKNVAAEYKVEVRIVIYLNYRGPKCPYIIIYI